VIEPADLLVFHTLENNALFVPVVPHLPFFSSLVLLHPPFPFCPTTKLPQPTTTTTTSSGISWSEGSSSNESKAGGTGAAVDAKNLSVPDFENDGGRPADFLASFADLERGVGVGSGKRARAYHNSG
jgi:hypothetical protein